MVCLLYFPRQQQNHPFMHLRHAISHLHPTPPLYYCPHSTKAFPIHSQQHSLSNCRGQRGRPDIQTGKSAETIPTKWDWVMENKARGEMKGKPLLVLIAVFKNAQLKKCLESQTYLCSPLLILWFIFSSVHRCSQKSPGDWIQLYGIIRHRGLCMQTGPECGHAEVSASTLGPLPSEAAHVFGLSHGVDVCMEKM